MRFLTSCLLSGLAAVVPATAQSSKPASAPASKPTSQSTKAKVPNPYVQIKTSLGDITLELFANEAPKTVANFIGLAEGTKEYTDPKKGQKTKGNYYDGLIFHRVIKGFMAQGGCPLGSGGGSPGYKFEDEINAKALGLHKEKAFADGRPTRLTGIRSQQEFRRLVVAPLFRKLGIKSQEELDKRRGDVQKALDKMSVMDVLQARGYKYDFSRPSHGMLRGTIAMANSGPNTNGSQFFINMVDNKYLNGKHTVFGRVVSGMEVVDKMAEVKTSQSRPEQPIKIVSVRQVDAPANSKKNGQ